MTKFQEGYNATGVFESIDNADNILDENKDKFEHEAYAIANAQLVRIREVLENVDPDILGQAAINNANQVKNQIVSFTNNLSAWASTSDQNQYNVAINALTNAITNAHFQALAVYASTPQTKKEQKETREQYVQLSRKMAKRLEITQSTIDKLNEEKQSLLDELEALKKNIKDANTELSETLNEKINEISLETENTVKALNEEVQQRLEEKESQAQTALENIENIYELASDEAVTGSFSKAAVEEKNSFKLWRRISIVVYICAIIWLVLTLVIPNIFHTTDTYGVIRSIVVTTLFIGLGSYSAYQSLGHRNQYKRLQKFALEVKALKPFIANLPEGKQNELIEELTKKIFGNESKDETEKASYSLTEINKLTDTFQKLIAK